MSPTLPVRVSGTCLKSSIFELPSPPPLNFFAHSSGVPASVLVAGDTFFPSHRWPIDRLPGHRRPRRRFVKSARRGRSTFDRAVFSLPRRAAPACVRIEPRRCPDRSGPRSTSTPGNFARPRMPPRDRRSGMPPRVPDTRPGLLPFRAAPALCGFSLPRRAAPACVRIAPHMCPPNDPIPPGEFPSASNATPGPSFRDAASRSRHPVGSAPLLGGYGASSAAI